MLTLLSSFFNPLFAWQPNAVDFDVAVQSGDFTGYFAHVTTWLDKNMPTAITRPAMEKLLEPPLVLMLLGQRQLISKTGLEPLAAFIKADPANQVFLTWLLKNTPAMELYLEASVPIGLAAREEDSYRLPVAALEIWQKILSTDPAAKNGIYLKLAIATAIAPPGSVNIGAGAATSPAKPVTRYQ